MPRQAAPEDSCGEGGAGAPPVIVAPQRGVVHLMRVGAAQPLPLRAESAGRGTVTWFADDALVGRAKPGETLEWTPPRPGRYTLRAVDGNGLADSRVVSVESVE